MDQRLLLTTDEAARVLGIGKSHLYVLLQRGELTGVKIGRSRRIPRHELDGYVQRLCEAQAERALDE